MWCCVNSTPLIEASILDCLRPFQDFVWIGTESKEAVFIVAPYRKRTGPIKLWSWPVWNRACYLLILIASINLCIKLHMCFSKETAFQVSTFRITTLANTRNFTLLKVNFPIFWRRLAKWWKNQAFWWARERDPGQHLRAPLLIADQPDLLFLSQTGKGGGTDYTIWQCWLVLCFLALGQDIMFYFLPSSARERHKERTRICFSHIQIPLVQSRATVKARHWNHHFVNWYCPLKHSRADS